MRIATADGPFHGVLSGVPQFWGSCAPHDVGALQGTHPFGPPRWKAPGADIAATHLEPLMLHLNLSHAPQLAARALASQQLWAAAADQSCDPRETAHVCCVMWGLVPVWCADLSTGVCFRKASPVVRLQSLPKRGTLGTSECAPRAKSTHQIAMLECCRYV